MAHICNLAVELPSEVQIVFYADGVTEHNRDALRGELELVEACRAVYDHPVPDAARAIAQRVFKTVRGHDDAAVAVLRERPLLDFSYAGPTPRERGTQPQLRVF